MKRKSHGFTLIEVMLAVAIFAFAAVGFAVALNDVLGINLEMVRANQRRQAVESMAAKLLASSNNLPDQGKQWQTEEKYRTWNLEKSVSATTPITITGNNNTASRLVSGWVQVSLRAQGKGETLDAVSFLLWPQR
ncbi:MAG: prepilin-type N-terminal cleavage/methylation domain-containing protein [Verrucomicrobia bacterium]|nr:prepilin-type N-terminal cleavage/methylation domain-containing protein [Verrucomicrobiota bacterium]